MSDVLSEKTGWLTDARLDLLTGLKQPMTLSRGITMYWMVYSLIGKPPLLFVALAAVLQKRVNANPQPKRTGASLSFPQAAAACVADERIERPY